ncbi:hypothetical protein D9613_010241 [Agrocybe pediades]|uniref:Uncharacterized protein n=1 Tax=Agrocybe pediades TaxID=84607 RepID=A0A8H4VJ81_9AGAR|nr:hypothetical protein D9613_010241 [Agrocybe pediades]
MQFKLSSLIAFASFTSSALAVNYRGYANTVSCSGDAFGCSDGGAVCCSLPTGFGFSAQFDNLPAGTQGQGYTGGGCTDFLFSVFGSGTKCWNGGGARATHLNWFHSPQRRSIAIAERANEDAGAECAEPTFFEYQNTDGTVRTIKVPADKGAAQKIADLHLAKNYTALAAYEEY